MENSQPVIKSVDRLAQRAWAPALLLLSVGSMVFAGYAVATNRAAQAFTLNAAASAIPTMIEQPKQWVAFSADLALTHGDGRPPVVGRYFRDTHGCTRTETGPQDGVAVIFIQNVSRSEYYSWNKRRDQWTAGPMKLPAGGWKPIERPEGTAGLDKYPLFVEIRRGKTYNLRADAGLTAYRYVNIGGTLALQVPEMNFFDIVKQTLEGRREVYSNVEFSDQPEELFTPPAGASVTSTTVLGGIMVDTTGTAAEHIEHSVRGVKP